MPKRLPASARSSQCVFDRVRVPGDHGEEHTRRSIRASPALLPIPQRRSLEPEFLGEFRLTQSQASTCRTHVDRRNLQRGYADRDVLPFSPIDRLLQARNDSAARGWLAPLGGARVLHFAILFRYPEMRRGNNPLISFCSALVRFA